MLTNFFKNFSCKVTSSLNFINIIGSNLNRTYSVFKRIFRSINKIGILGTIYSYFVGYMRWSTMWLIPLVILFLYFEQIERGVNLRKVYPKASKTTNKLFSNFEKTDFVPSWDTNEICVCLNKAVEHLWTDVNHLSQSLVNAIPGLFGIKIKEVHFGKNPPHIESLTIYKQSVELNEIIIDFEFFFDNNCEIKFLWILIKGGFKDFQLRGCLRVLIKPLDGKLKIFFVKNPNIEFELIGGITKLDIFGFVCDIARQTFLKIIARTMVFPNKLEFSLKEKNSTTKLK